MNDPHDEKIFRTLKGFLEGQEPDEEIYFAYSAALRIFGDIGDLDAISRQLGVTPSSSYRRGDRIRPSAPPRTQDMWSYKVPLPESEPLHRHIDALWDILRPHKKYLLALKERHKVDVFLGYRSNCDHAGVEVPPESLAMFTELRIPFGLSIIIA